MRHERIGVGEFLRLALDRLDDARVPVARVDAHQLAVEVDVSLPFGGVEVDALGMVDRDGVDRGLRGPFVERVLATEGDNLLAAQHVGSGTGL